MGAGQLERWEIRLRGGGGRGAVGCGWKSPFVIRFLSFSSLACGFSYERDTTLRDPEAMVRR